MLAFILASSALLTTVCVCVMCVCVSVGQRAVRLTEGQEAGECWSGERPCCSLKD